MGFRIAQISDTHLSREKPFFVANFARTAEALAESRPDLVVNTGDISLDGASHEQDLAAAFEMHCELRSPVRFIPGNHDLGDTGDTEGHGEGPIDPERRECYRRRFGSDWWSLDVPGWRLIAVNAQLCGSVLDASDEQRAFVAEAAAGADGRQIALFIHKPLFDASPEETAIGGRFVNPVPRQALLAAFGKRRPALVASGHVHQFRSTDRDGTRHVWAPSTAFVIPDARQPRYGLKEVGYVEHVLHADGSHASRYVRPPGAVRLDATDFVDAYYAPR